MTSGVRGPVEGQLPRGGIKGGDLQIRLNTILAKGRSRTYTSKLGGEELDPSKDEGQGQGLVEKRAQSSPTKV